MKETWKDVPGYIGYYQVSNKGKVKSLDRYVFHPRCKTKRQFVQGKILIADITPQGYCQVTLSKNAKTKVKKVHHLVMEAFVGSRPKNLVVNHKNGIRHDNRLQNLEYVTLSENMLHAIHELGAKVGTPPIMLGSDNLSAKITKPTVLLIRQLRNTGLTYKEISKKIGLSISQVARISKNQSWKHVKP